MHLCACIPWYHTSKPHALGCQGSLYTYNVAMAVLLLDCRPLLCSCITKGQRNTAALSMADRCDAAWQVIRELIPPVAKWVSSNRVTMGLLNNGTLIIIVWVQLCSAHTKIFQQPFQDIVLIIIGAVLLHFVFVAINWPLVA